MTMTEKIITVLQQMIEQTNNSIEQNRYAELIDELQNPTSVDDYVTITHTVYLDAAAKQRGDIFYQWQVPVKKECINE